MVAILHITSMEQISLNDDNLLNRWRRLSYLQSLFGVESVLAPVLTIFYLSYAGYTFTQYSTMIALCFLFLWLIEIPAGALADRIGRKTALVVGNIIYIIAMLSVLIWRNDIPIIMVAFLFSVGTAVTGSSFQSMMYDVYASKDAEEEFHKAMAKSTSISLFAAAAAAIIGGVLAEVNIVLPMMVDIALLSLATAIISLAVVEPASTVPHKKDSTGGDTYFKIMKSGFMNAFSSWYMINFILCAAVIFATLRVAFNFYQPLLMAAQVPYYQIGGIFSALFLLSAASAYFFSHIKKRLLSTGLPELIFFALFLTSAILILDIGNVYSIVAAICLHQIVRGMYPSLTSYIFNINIENGRADRTTTLATASFFRASITGIATYLSGIFSDSMSANTIYSMLSIASAISLLFLLAFRFANREISG